MEATTTIPVALVLPHVVFMTATGGDLFHRTRDCDVLGSADDHDVYAVGRASAQAVGRTACAVCFTR